MENKIYSECRLCSLLEASLFDLQRDAERGFPNTKKRQHVTQPVVASSLKILPYIGTKVLYFQFTTKSGTEAGKFYKTIISFKNVVFEKEKTPENIEFIAGDNKTYYIKPLSQESSQVRVRCDCLDFYFRFVYQDYRDQALYGPKAKAYVRKTDTYPPANPRDLKGMCKHVMKCVQILEKSGFFG